MLVLDVIKHFMPDHSKEPFWYRYRYCTDTVNYPLQARLVKFLARTGLPVVQEIETRLGNGRTGRLAATLGSIQLLLAVIPHIRSFQITNI
jgi:hypothetical protein